MNISVEDLFPESFQRIKEEEEANRPDPNWFAHLPPEKINQQQMITLLNENMPGRKSVSKVTLSEDRLSKYFPPFYSQDDMEKVLIQLLEIWKQNQTQNDE